MEVRKSRNFRFSGFESDYEMENKLYRIKNVNMEPSLLKEAVYLNNASLVQKLIQKNADPNLEMNHGILHEACKNISEDPTGVLSILVNHVSDLDQPDDRGNSPLFYLVRNDHRTAAKLLIDSKANIRCPAFIGGEKTSLLWVAVREGHTQFIKYFFRCGFDPKEKLWGTSIFLHLLNHNFYEAAEYMLEKGHIHIMEARKLWAKCSAYRREFPPLTDEEREMKNVFHNYHEYVEEAYLVIFLEVMFTLPIETCDGWISERAFFTPEVQKWTKHLEDYYRKNKIDNV